MDGGSAATEVRGAALPASAGTGPPLHASVCIPSRNRVDLLKQALESLDRQSLTPDRYEVVVTDDGSTDGTDAMLRTLRPRFRLRWARLEGRGSGAARNAAARLADGEVLIFLDDDQIASPDLVAVHLETHAQRGVVIVQGDYRIANGFDRDGASRVFERVRLRAIESPAIPFHLWGGNFSVRRDTWSQVGGFDETLPRSQDLDFGLRVTDLGVPHVIELRATSHHRHRVSPAAYRRHCFNEGRCMVRIARKRGVPVASLLMVVDRPLDRIAKGFWERFPRSADLAGRGLAGLLWLSDRVQLAPAQMVSARLVLRFHGLGGRAREMAMPASVPDSRPTRTLILPLQGPNRPIVGEQSDEGRPEKG
jgi:glycosyltransferase involved in cell wall biosynthesis